MLWKNRLMAGEFRLKTPGLAALGNHPSLPLPSASNVFFRLDRRNVSFAISKDSADHSIFPQS